MFSFRHPKSDFKIPSTLFNSKTMGDHKDVRITKSSNNRDSIYKGYLLGDLSRDLKILLELTKF